MSYILLCTIPTELSYNESNGNTVPEETFVSVCFLWKTFIEYNITYITYNIHLIHNFSYQLRHERKRRILIWCGLFSLHWQIIYIEIFVSVNFLPNPKQYYILYKYIHIYILLCNCLQAFFFFYIYCFFLSFNEPEWFEIIIFFFFY